MNGRREFLQAAMAAAAWTALPTYATKVGDAPLRILVLGGTGFLGPHFVEAAHRRGHRLTLFNRGKTNPARFDGSEYDDIEQLRGDRKTDLSALEGEQRWDAVLDTSAYLPADVRRSAGLLAPRVGQYLIVSSISVYADNTRAGDDETAAVGTLIDPTVTDITGDTYGPLKALCEQAAEAALPGRTTVVRPGLIVGPGDTTDRFTYWPARAWRGGEILAPGSASDPTQFIDVRDLAEFMLHLIETRQYSTFNADAPAGALTMGALLSACQQAGMAANAIQCIKAPCPQPPQSQSRLTWVPADFLEQHEVTAWQDMPVWIPPTGEYAGFGRRSSAKAQAAGLRYRGLQQTVDDTLRWWLQLPEERRASLKAGLTAERERAVLRAWHQQAASK